MLNTAGLHIFGSKADWERGPSGLWTQKAPMAESFIVEDEEAKSYVWLNRVAGNWKVMKNYNSSFSGAVELQNYLQNCRVRSRCPLAPC